VFIDLTNCPSVAQDPMQYRVHPRQMLPDNFSSYCPLFLLYQKINPKVSKLNCLENTDALPKLNP